MIQSRVTVIIQSHTPSTVNGLTNNVTVMATNCVRGRDRHRHQGKQLHLHRQWVLQSGGSNPAADPNGNDVSSHNPVDCTGTAANFSVLMHMLLARGQDQ